MDTPSHPIQVIEWEWPSAGALAELFAAELAAAQTGENLPSRESGSATPAIAWMHGIAAAMFGRVRPAALVGPPPLAGADSAAARARVGAVLGIARQMVRAQQRRLEVNASGVRAGRRRALGVADAELVGLVTEIDTLAGDSVIPLRGEVTIGGLMSELARQAAVSVGRPMMPRMVGSGTARAYEMRVDRLGRRHGLSGGEMDPAQVELVPDSVALLAALHDGVPVGAVCAEILRAAVDVADAIPVTRVSEARLLKYMSGRAREDRLWRDAVRSLMAAKTSVEQTAGRIDVLVARAAGPASELLCTDFGALVVRIVQLWGAHRAAGEDPVRAERLEQQLRGACRDYDRRVRQLAHVARLSRGAGPQPTEGWPTAATLWTVLRGETASVELTPIVKAFMGLLDAHRLMLASLTESKASVEVMAQFGRARQQIAGWEHDIDQAAAANGATAAALEAMQRSEDSRVQTHTEGLGSVLSRVAEQFLEAFPEGVAATTSPDPEAMDALLDTINTYESFCVEVATGTRRLPEVRRPRCRLQGTVNGGLPGSFL
ncbi:hypothetical protein [Nocardia sp. NPDC050710]|uniref:hypothetical protein n=1 Tax=Nocardia sp. NPDC050710 TaxID=3157220 RepID=UPI0033EAD6CA